MASCLFTPRLRGFMRCAAVLFVLLPCCLATPADTAAAQKGGVKAGLRNTTAGPAKKKLDAQTARTAVEKNKNAASKPNAAVLKKAEGKKNAAARSKTAHKAGKSASAPVKAYITMDLTRKTVVNAYNADRPIAPASLTKVLTMFVILDQVKTGKLSLDGMVQVSRKAAGTGGSTVNLHAGQRVRLSDLLRGMAVASGNDAAVAAAQHVAGSEQSFVRLMNRKAKALGMTRSVFKNVHGLPARGQHSTARDLLTMTRSYLAAHPGALGLFHSRPYLDLQSLRPNTNPLLGHVEGVDGLKTGYVASSGYNLITTARYRNTRLVSVVLGAPSKEVRLQEARRLLRDAYARVDAAETKKAAAGSRKKAGKTPGFAGTTRAAAG
ncbi:MAG: D-alanyl-D-alanine carboxypeptidase [Desulfovibrio sp.]|jgi:D-alanyl-D-alanine carboxypeptidase (penicillin-binding protein 5/6)|nr:D-alanyl-D-alanine carboxypeptidase [Desulfovibrio sp.]